MDVPMISDILSNGYEHKGPALILTGNKLVESFMTSRSKRILEENHALQQGQSRDPVKLHNPRLLVNANLCRFCSRLLQADWFSRTPHHLNFMDLSASGNSCSLCSKIAGRLAYECMVKRRLKPEQFVENEIWSQLHAFVSDAFGLQAESGPIQVYPKELQIGVTAHSKPTGRRPEPADHGLEEGDLVTIALEIAHMPSHIDHALQAFERQVRSIAPSSDLTNRLQLARTWLRHCEATHTLCAIKNHEVRALPTRLLDVSQVLEGGEVRLVNGFELTTSYAALSHRWGGHEGLTTTTYNIARHSRGIPWAEIPLLYRDAIKVTRALDLSYLWIDSLCIVQDSKDDWLQESEIMGHIYRGATVTVACVDSDHADRVSNLEHVPMIKVRPSFLGNVSFALDRATADPSGNKSTNQYVEIVQITSGKEDSFRDRGLLDERAWVLQEEVLSPRVLSITDRGLAWECATCDSTEARPGEHKIDKVMTELVATGRRYSRAFKQALVLHPEPVRERSGDVYLDTIWKSLVQNYTKRILTRDSDAILAMKGISDIVTQKTGWHYVLGLWRECIHDDLLWHVHPGRLDFKPSVLNGELGMWRSEGLERLEKLQPPHRREDLEAPSWTWFTSAHQLRFATSRAAQQLMTIDDVHVEELAHNKWRGYLKVTGVTALAVAVMGDIGLPDVLRHPSNEGVRAHWYYCDDVEWQDPKVLCVAVSRSHFVNTLVLAKCEDGDLIQAQYGNIEGQLWRRVGFAEWKPEQWKAVVVGISASASGAGADNSCSSSMSNAEFETNECQGSPPIEDDKGVVLPNTPNQTLYIV